MPGTVPTMGQRSDLPLSASTDSLPMEREHLGYDGASVFLCIMHYAASQGQSLPGTY